MKTIQIYKTNIGVFVKNFSSNYYNNGNMQGVRLNGFENLPLENGYALLRGAETITTYETLQKAGKNLTGYALSNALLASDVIPLTLTQEAVSRYYDDSSECYLWEFFNDIRPLYKEVYETIPEEWVVEDFVVEIIREFEIEGYNKPVDMKIITGYNSFAKEDIKVDLSSIVRYSDIEKLLTPEFLLHERPCSLSSEQVYKIVRSYIKENIDGRYATITSDYDFCFTVKRVIAVKPYVTLWEEKKANGRSYAKPHINSKKTVNKHEEIFEMTDEKQHYSTYTPISGWDAYSLKGMKEHLEAYLINLMSFINTPVAECQHCNGSGHIVSSMPTNKRV